MQLIDYLAAVIKYDPNTDPYNTNHIRLLPQTYNHLPVSLRNAAGNVSGEHRKQLVRQIRDAVLLQIAIENEWRNGVFLSELIASTLMKGKNKDLVKQV